MKIKGSGGPGPRFLIALLSHPATSSYSEGSAMAYMFIDQGLPLSSISITHENGGNF